MSILTTLIVIFNVVNKPHGWSPVRRVFGQRPRDLPREVTSVQGPTTEQFNDKLRAVSWRRLDRDIVAAGFFKKIHVREAYSKRNRTVGTTKSIAAMPCL